MPQPSKNNRPSDKQQKQRTFRNKQAQRAKHARLYPNDKESLARATRWIEVKQGK